jgi:NAD+ synthase (glutamine-hydrolysing)
MKIALAQINCHVGHFEHNVSKIIAGIRKAEQLEADLVVFPELAICGYPPLDFLDYHHFTDACVAAMEQIAKNCTRISAIIGGPAHNPVLKGKNLFNSAYVLSDGMIRQVVHKTLLPTYDVFDEYRYFEPNNQFHTIRVNGERIALTICEDLWNEEDDPMYIVSPMEKLMSEKPSCIINIAASPYDYSHRIKRQAILKRNVDKYGLPLIYVNHVGAQTDLIFDGGSLAMNGKGEIVEELAYFREDLRMVDTGATPNTLTHGNNPDEKISGIHKALVLGISDYFRKMNFSKAVLGLSGGVDSALVLALAAEALGRDHVVPVMMPSPFSSSHSLTDSIELCRNLGIEPMEIPIHGIFQSFLDATKDAFGDKPFDVAEENIQARIRGTLVMALSNKHGLILLNTSNKSELAVGYGTLYGDMAGGLSVIGDLYKTDVYQLCRYLNRNGVIIPENILTKAPSAELRPGQKDTDSLPEYEVLDRLLYRYIECQEGPDQILKSGFDEKLVSRVLRMVNSNEYKRFQFMPVLRISPKAFGRGRRMPLVAKYLS